MTTLIDPEAPTRQQSQLLALFSRLSREECAAVALVYQIPWLLSQAMQDDGWTDEDKICTFFKVRDTDELEQIVEAIVTRLGRASLA